jgi:hypothetical protein
LSSPWSRCYYYGEFRPATQGQDDIAQRSKDHASALTGPKKNLLLARRHLQIWPDSGTIIFPTLCLPRSSPSRPKTNLQLIACSSKTSVTPQPKPTSRSDTSPVNFRFTRGSSKRPRQSHKPVPNTIRAIVKGISKSGHNPFAFIQEL